MSHSTHEPLGQCQERAGFLFSHDCPRPATRQCARCAKPICDEHGHVVSAEVLCTGCTREAQQAAGKGRAAEADTSDPFLYASYHYRDYGYYGHGTWGHGVLHDPNDFTEADGESLRASGDTRDFEEDMSGS